MVTVSFPVFALIHDFDVTVFRTVDAGQGDDGHSDLSAGGTARQLSQHTELFEIFPRVVVAFARGSQPQAQLATSREGPAVARLDNAIIRFIVAHEFGHVIAGHHDGKMVAVHAVASPGVTLDYARISRDWKAELEADNIGQQLVASAPANPGLLVESDVLAAYAPALILEMFEPIEDAVLCGGSGIGSRSTLDPASIGAVRQLAAGQLKSTGNQTSVESTLGCRATDHPPAWLRAELLKEHADALYESGNRTDAAYAKALIRNAQYLARITAPLIKQELQAR